MNQFLEIDGLRIRYKQAGSGAPVLLLHGWGGSIESLDPVFNALSSHLQATSIDFPGHGESSLPPGPWRVSDFLTCTLKLMDRLGLEQPHLLAHSFGGRVSIKMAAAFPHRAGKILFAAGAGVKPPLSMRLRVKRLIASSATRIERAAHNVVPAAEPWLRRLHARMSPHLSSGDYRHAGPLRQTLRHVIEEDLTPLLASIRSKCLLVWGDQDQETPLYCGRVMARLIPSCELVVYPGAGHFPYLDQLHKFNLLALKFFRE